MTTLVLAYGNPLRRDDGAALVVVERLRECQGRLAQWEHQLLPEQAELLTRYERVIFVDAAVTGDSVQVRRLEPEQRSPSLGHTGNPAWLLALSLALYEHRPCAWLVTIPVHDLGFGEGLSPETERAVGIAVERIEELCTNSG